MSPAYPGSFDSLIFDLDGTLWDSTQPVTEAWNRAIERLGNREVLSESDIAGIMGLSQDKIFEKFFPSRDEKERQRLADECCLEEIRVLRCQGAALYPGVETGLKSLSESFSLYLVSNCQSAYLEAFFECTGFRALFQDSECHGATGLSKAENIARLLKRNRLSSAAYIGDTAGDQIAAEKAGATYFHVTYGFGDPKRDCLTFDSFAELTVFFLQLTGK